jgi:single-strand DNA-binding protein
MASYNRVILVGNLTRDVELRYTPSGTAVTEIGLAVNDRRKSASGEWIEETTFVDVTLWGRTAEVASEYLSKGSNMLVEGRLKLDRWESKEGQKMSKLRVVGERMQMLGSRGGGSGGSRGGGSAGGASSGGGRPAAYDESEYSSSGGGDSFESSDVPAASTPPPQDDIPF